MYTTIQDAFSVASDLAINAGFARYVKGVSLVVGGCGVYQGEVCTDTKCIYIPQFSLSRLFEPRPEFRNLTCTVLHEIGHIVFSQLTQLRRKKLQKAFKTKSPIYKYREQFVTTPRYCLNKEEDFCESFAAYCYYQEPNPEDNEYVARKLKFIAALAR